METDIYQFTKEAIGNSAVYEKDGQENYFRITDVNEQEQLFELQEMYKDSKPFWVRTDNVNYIPF